MKIGMVADYPPKGAKHTNGNAPYSKNLALPLPSNDISLTVFANKVDGKGEEYVESNIRVVRCWEKGIFYLFQILAEVWRKRNEIQLIHFQHEYFYYGNIFTAALFPFMLLLMKLLRKPIVVTLHGVVPLSEVEDTFSRSNYIKGNPYIIKIGLSIITKAISCFASKIIVHEVYLGELLAGGYGIKGEKIAVIHHGIEEDKPADREKSKDILSVQGKKVVMFFGYFSGYKGLHILIDAFRDIGDKEYVLLVVGGENPRQRGRPEYEDYLRSLKERASSTSAQIRFTGFIPEEEIPLYFSAADVVVLPYTTVMSACGPLTQCITYKRPFLLSEPFKVVIGDEDLLFRNNPRELKNKIEEFFSDKELEQKSLKYGEMLFQERSWAKAGAKTAELYRELLK